MVITVVHDLYTRTRHFSFNNIILARRTPSVQQPEYYCGRFLTIAGKSEPSRPHDTSKVKKKKTKYGFGKVGGLRAPPKPDGLEKPRRVELQDGDDCGIPRRDGSHFHAEKSLG